MKTKSKALLLSLCVILLAAASVFGTLAYLTDTAAVTNTFTVGKVGLTLDEAKVNEAGEPVDKDGNKVTLDNAQRVKENTYKLMPGHTYTKDPTVTVAEGSEESYVRMLVTVDDISKLTAAFPEETYADYYNNGVFLLQKLVGGWDGDVWVSTGSVTSDANEADKVTYEFRYKETVDGDDGKLPALFTSITVPEEFDGKALENLAGAEITVVAHAIQADGFADANAAWDAWEN